MFGNQRRKGGWCRGSETVHDPSQITVRRLHRSATLHAKTNHPRAAAQELRAPPVRHRALVSPTHPTPPHTVSRVLRVPHSAATPNSPFPSSTPAIFVPSPPRPPPPPHERPHSPSIPHALLTNGPRPPLCPRLHFNRHRPRGPPPLVLPHVPPHTTAPRQSTTYQTPTTGEAYHGSPTSAPAPPRPPPPPP